MLDREYTAHLIAVEEMPVYADSWNWSMTDAENDLLELTDAELIERYTEVFHTELDSDCLK